VKRAPEWFARVCELEDQGRFEEARRLFEAEATPDECEAWEIVVRAMKDAVAAIPPEAIAEAEEIMQRFRALKALPEHHPKRIIWERFWDSNPAFMAPFWRHLPDPTAIPGRPKNSSKITDEMLAEMDRRHAAEERPTTAARAIVGEVAGQKNRADHLVRVWKRSRGIN
jgi:hypothetical protein